MTVPYKILSRECATGHHASCNGTACLHGPLGPYKPGDPCMCQCHTPEGLPDHRKPPRTGPLP